MTDVLQERIEHEVRFTSDVSHELRSPLTTLVTALGVLESHRDEIPERSRHALDLLTAELRRFRRMVDDLLEISRVEHRVRRAVARGGRGGRAGPPRRCRGGAGDVPVEVDPAVAGVRLPVDKRRIERVVTNLVANASQYAGGVTRVAVEPAPGAVRLVVADHGPGVLPAERERVFERFYRGQSAGQRGATEGTGLGLSLVAEHVRLHGGRVWVECDADGENRFVVELPLSGDVTAGDDDAPTQAGPEETVPLGTGAGVAAPAARGDEHPRPEAHTP